MAELKSYGRQVAQPNAPDISGAAEAAGSFGKTVEQAAAKVGQYVDSVNRLEANAQYSETLNILNKELVNAMSTENIAKGGAYERYIQSAESIIAGGLEQAPRKYRAEFQQELRQKVNSLGLKLAQADLSFREAARKSEGMAIISTHLDSLNEAVASGDEDGARNEQFLIDRSVDDLVSIGAMNALDAKKIKDSATNTIARSDYTNHFANLLRNNPVEADTFLRELVEKKPEHLTYEQWNDVQASVLKQRNQFYQMVDAASTLGFNQFKVAFDSGLINSTEDIDKFVIQSEANGLYVSENDKLKMQDMLLNRAKGNSKKIETLLAIDNDVATNPDNLYTYSAKQLNDWYQVKAKAINDEIAAKKEADPEGNYPSPLAVKATIASKLPVSVPAFEREFGDKLQFGTIGDFEEALKVGEQLRETNPKTYTMLPKENQAYESYAASLYGNTSLPVEDIRRMANKTIFEQDSATKDRIQKQLGDIRKTSTLPDLFKNIYDVKTFNPALQPQYNNMVDAFDAFYAATGDKNIAKSLTSDYMNVRTGKSKYIPTGDITKDPIEKTAAYQESPIFVENQMAVGLREVIHLNELQRKNGDKNSDVYEWPDDIEMPDFATINQNEFFDKPIFNRKGKAVEPQIKVNGKNRKLLFMNPNQNIEDNRADQRQIYYEDEYGIARPLTVYQEKDYGNGLIKIDAGIPSIEFQSVSQLAPEVAKRIEERSINDQAVKHLKEEFKASMRDEKPPVEEEEGRAGKKSPVGNAAVKEIPTTPHPLARIMAQKERMQKEEAYVGERLQTKVKELKAAKKAKIDKLLSGEK